MKAENNTLSPGTILHSSEFTYRITEFLGQGSFGITYLATTQVKGKAVVSGSLGNIETEGYQTINVAIKEFFMKETNSRSYDGSTVEGTSGELTGKYRKKFRKEAENLSHLNHPNIVKVLEVFDENNTTYYAMQYIPGQNLDDYIKLQGHLEEKESIRIIRTVAEALQYMHERKMLHLDLKPKNIMLSANGTPYLIDFGLSKQYLDNGEPESSTTIGLGTPGYAPIEQADYIQDGTFPATLDIYALGGTLYKMVTGETPPSASDVLAYSLKIPNIVTKSTKSLILDAMCPNKTERIQSIAEFGSRIDMTTDKRTTYNDEEEVKEKVKNNLIDCLRPYIVGGLGIILILLMCTINNMPLEIRDVVGYGIGDAEVLNRNWNLCVLLLCISLLTIIYFLFSKRRISAYLSVSSFLLSLVCLWCFVKKCNNEDNISSTKINQAVIPQNFVLVEGGLLNNYKEWNWKKEVNETINITIDSFYVDKFELTQFEYERVMGSLEKRNYSFQPVYLDEEPVIVKGDSIPVLGTYMDFVLYCNKRSEMEGYDGFYIIERDNVSIKRNGNGYRLMNEYEWVFAAKGGNLNEKYKYIGGNNLGEVAWYGGNSGNKPHVVGKKKPNGLGIFDMLGNILELLEEERIIGSEPHHSTAGSEYKYWVGFGIDDIWFSESLEGTRIVLIPKELNNNNVSLLRRKISDGIINNRIVEDGSKSGLVNH